MSNITMRRGALIVLEGCDKVGKTTQCKKLVQKLCELGVSAQMMNFPDRSTATGRIINDFLNLREDVPDEAIHLIFSANRWENQSKIKQILEDGVTLIIDRYSYSGVAYSAAKPGMDFDWCIKPEIGLPKPDVVFFLHLTSDKMISRKEFGEERYENEEYLKNVEKMFLKMKQENWLLLDASRGIEELHEDLLKHVKDAISKAQTKELEVLW